MKYPIHYDVIIVGGGHAGTEAALAAARLNARTLLLTHNIETLGQMSCNPAIGGPGKSHLVKEIDAMGGIIALGADHAGIHFRKLNRSKGPAVQATRAQADRALYKAFIRHTLENQPNLTIFQQAVDDLIIENAQVKGVVTQLGIKFYASSVVLTVGTFLSGKIHVGNVNYAGGRAGDPPSIALAHTLNDLDLAVGRLKTGTPPRIDGKTIDYSKLQPQPGDEPRPVFSYIGSRNLHPQQVSCYITHTTEKTHEIIRANLHRSAMYSGEIEGVGPRYCPSIEDKVVRFAGKAAHQIFVEPEGLSTSEVYPNGISTSLPFDVQWDFIHSISGFENAHITRPGYAIEYNYFDPRGLKGSLETKKIQGLFFAGQINGTTGYEEAAAQGLVAGINAALQAQNRELWYPRRDESYIGVLIDDLITCGTNEPYRMFTSRAEYRLSLREDNADARLTPFAYSIGLISAERWQKYCEKQEAIEGEQKRLATLCIQPDSLAAIQLKDQGIEIQKEARLVDLLKRPECSYQKLMQLDGIGPGVEEEFAAEQLDIQAKYQGYIHRQEGEIDRIKRYENIILPDDLEYIEVVGLSNEVQQKLSHIRPKTLAQASRISGITPAAISLLLVHMKRRGYKMLAG